MDSDVGESTLESKTCPIETSCDITSAEFGCYICYEVPKDPIVTLCGHLFCQPCIREWLHSFSRSKQCPVCNGHLNDGKLISIHGRGRSLERPNSPNDIPNSLSLFNAFLVNIHNVLCFLWKDFPPLGASLASLSCYIISFLFCPNSTLACCLAALWCIEEGMDDDDDLNDDDSDGEDDDGDERQAIRIMKIKKTIVMLLLMTLIGILGLVEMKSGREQNIGRGFEGIIIIGILQSI